MRERERDDTSFNFERGKRKRKGKEKEKEEREHEAEEAVILFDQTSSSSRKGEEKIERRFKESSTLI